MPSNLTWPEARALAIGGAAVRRAAWETNWVTFGRALWFIGPQGESGGRVVESPDFGAPEFLATDWTTEPYAEADPCARPPRPRVFSPPAVDLAATPDDGALVIRATLGPGTFGAYWLYYFVNEEFVGAITATAAGDYPLSVPMDPEELEATISVDLWVIAAPPLPTWRKDAALTIPGADYIAIDLATHFPGGGVFDPPGYPYGAGVTFGPYGITRYVYSHADEPAAVDDDLEINGVRLFGDSAAGPINGGVTTLLHTIPAGDTMTVNVWNAGGPYSASGKLRLYNRPIG